MEALIIRLMDLYNFEICHKHRETRPSELSAGLAVSE